MMSSILRTLFTLCIVWPVIWLWLGLRIRHRDRLPIRGPAIIVANHNSHMDVFALLSLFPLRRQASIHPVAAADYFLRNKAMAWFALNILNIIPISRKGGETNPLAQCEQALRDGKILILFPEGTRGEPGKLSPLKSGLWHLSQRVPDVPIIPVWLRGTEHVMAKGNRIPLPLFIDVNIGRALRFHDDKHRFMDELRQQLLLLQQQTTGMQPHE
ncbi:1-acyl-sn-glycerol-3-phosphate acyltransferase [Citrobacter sp. DNRA3]|uniref:lysophospholipid acyltransferase family protein n=1 Tax=Citrobacter TaxID=544 RepID=UPI000CD1D518|nr:MULTISPECIES: lysophospholipid acyltransferase family protein [Citrobacter]EHL6942026.1 1-acyl-sn-glycerol-3-phosphate acyltransferase [Citrobacter freundii]AUV43723.1 1-acyl-sn-glycerol-3-phosphate acyltransferase [Citrobacter freundii complex sp. CFNIH9]EHL6950547.1 1-acyl-sn-glycerol-3-phosphate acyltransferase [Citrobacter freundii]MBA7977391.1 1-acyl-sn-glycerol-3-phosphate acyltransferase [Citrobacter freundii]MBJ8676307.1 1-acyl-sn-glycerol-3-phosphate acyltransferase [Citrobacter fr